MKDHITVSEMNPVGVKQIEKIMHDGLVGDNLIGRKWRVKLCGAYDLRYQFWAIKLEVYKPRCRKPIGELWGWLDTFKMTVEPHDEFGDWFFQARPWTMDINTMCEIFAENSVA